MSSNGAAAVRDEVLDVEDGAVATAAFANDPLPDCAGGDGLTWGLPFAHTP